MEVNISTSLLVFVLIFLGSGILFFGGIPSLIRKIFSLKGDSKTKFKKDNIDYNEEELEEIINILEQINDIKNKVN